MKKLLLSALLFSGFATAASAQIIGGGGSCVTIDFSPLSPQPCPYTVTVSAEAYNPFTGNYVMLFPQTVTLNPPSTATVCFSVPSGFAIVPGAYVFGVSNGTTSFTVDYVGNPSTPSYQTFPKNCYSTSNCHTNWERVSNNYYRLAPGCTVGGI